MIFSFEVAISTLNDGIYNININENISYIIIHQVVNGKNYEDFVDKLPHNVRYIVSFEKGLSKSRNIAIENANCDYLWIMDDDVTIKQETLCLIEEQIISNTTVSMFVVSHSIDNSATVINNGKNYYLNKISSKSISSIDMILNLKRIKKTRFDESFGLGSTYPSGEEFIFAIDLLNDGEKILKLPYICSIHNEISSGNDFYSTDIKLITKLKMFQRAFGRVFGRLFFLLFCVKKIPALYRNNAILRAFNVLFWKI